jgi:hypothetical protein
MAMEYTRMEIVSGAATVPNGTIDSLALEPSTFIFTDWRACLVGITAPMTNGGAIHWRDTGRKPRHIVCVPLA